MPSGPWGRGWEPRGQARRQPGQGGGRAVPRRHQNHHRPRCPQALGAGLGALPPSSATTRLRRRSSRSSPPSKPPATPLPSRPWGRGWEPSPPSSATARLRRRSSRSSPPSKPPRPLALRALGPGLGALAARLGDSQAKQAVEPFLAAIKATTNPYALAALGTGWEPRRQAQRQGRPRRRSSRSSPPSSAPPTPDALRGPGDGAGSRRRPSSATARQRRRSSRSSPLS